MSTIVKLKAVLDDIGPIGAGEATSMWFAEQQILEPYSKGKILETLEEERANDPLFSKHIGGQWECTDRAYWGISTVRCKCPGAPIGVAIGIAKEGSPSVIGQQHAVIYYWTLENNIWTASAYDPLTGPITDFETTAFVSFPPFRPNYNFGEAKLLPPFDKLKKNDNGWIMPSYNQEYDVANFNKIKSDLANDSFPTCNPPVDEHELEVYKNKRTREDRALWTYNQIRHKFNRSAVGFALGTNPNETDVKKKDCAAVVLWKSSTECIFWDMEKRAEVSSANFKPRFVLG